MKHPLGVVPDHVKIGMNNSIYLTRTLAHSPEDFINCGNLNYAAESASPFTITNAGLQIQLPLVPVFDQNDPFNSHNIPGWIGLLSCSEGSSQEFLGILLTPAGPGYDSSARVSRAQCLTDKGSYQTVVVSPRIAVRAALESITIIGSDQTQALRSYPFRYKHFVVNQSKAIQGLGYQVMDGTGLSVGEENQQENIDVPNWDPEKMILTVREDHASLVLFYFEPSSGDTTSKFTIVMSPSSHKAFIREEWPSSEDEQLSLYNSFKDASPSDETAKVMIRDSHGNMFEISVDIQSKTIHNRQIFELNVDAVQVADGNLSCGDSRIAIEQ